MSTRVIAQVTLDRDTALPEDVIVNTMHFEDDRETIGPDPILDGNVPGLVSRLSTFYQGIQSHLGGTLAGTGTIAIYNWNDAKPRAPYSETTFTFTPNAAALPGEVALCVSFRATRQSGVNAARQRGRIFIGPMSGSPTPVAGQADPRPTLAQQDAILTAFRTMSRGAAGTYRLAIFSPTTFSQTNNADQAWNDAAVAYIDNAWDTIRKRGARPTLRRQANLGSTAAITEVAA